MGKKIYNKTCKICNEPFVTSSWGRVYCSKECKRIGVNEIERKRQWKIRENRKPQTQNVDEVLAELNQYNKEHETCISYGKWVHMQSIQKGTKQ